MPIYTLRDPADDREWDVNCTYEQLQNLLTAGIERVYKPNNFITQSGSVMSRTDTDFRSHLKAIKKKYPGNTVND